MSVCVEPGCPRLVRSGRCQEHARTSARNHGGISRQARGYDAAYDANRALLVGRPCELRLPGCTGVGTTAQHTDDGRLVPACAHCNFADGARRRLTQDWAPWDPGACFIRVIGQPGSGKSMLGAALAQRFGLEHLDIANVPGHLEDPARAWTYFRRVANAERVAVVETAGTSLREIGFWDGAATITVICSAPTAVRRRRLIARAGEGYARNLLRIAAPEATGLPWDGTDPILGVEFEALASEIWRWLAGAAKAHRSYSEKDGCRAVRRGAPSPRFSTAPGAR